MIDYDLYDYEKPERGAPVRPKKPRAKKADHKHRYVVKTVTYVLSSRTVRVCEVCGVERNV